MRKRLLEACTLKSLARAGWVRAGVPDPESVAAHSWGVAWLVLTLSPPELDRGRALAMAVLHDLGEVRVGDLTPHDRFDPDDKTRRERAAVDDLVGPFDGGDELRALWDEYEAGESPEARFVRACDKLDMALQAEVYADRHGVDTEEFVRSAWARLEGADLTHLVRAPGPR